MSPRAPGRTVFRLADGRLRWRDGVGEEESRRLDENDDERFREWTRRYHRLLDKPDPREHLLDLGREMALWLDDDRRWLERSKADTAAPWVFEIAVSKRPNETEIHFLDAPQS